MAQQLKFRRGTTAQHSSFTGVEAEFTYDTQRKTVVVHDGSTVGGYPGGAFLAAGTGAVPHSIEHKLSEFISVQDFGAVGDGVTDDTVALQAAIVASYGKTLAVAGGGTFLTSGLVIADEIAIVGDSKTTIMSTGASCFNVSDQTIDGLVIENLVLAGVGAGAGGSDTTNGILGIDCKITNARIINNELKGLGQGISFSGGGLPINYTNPYDRPYTTEGNDGRCLIANNHIHDTLAGTRIGSGGGHGIYVQDSGYWQIIGNKIENMQGGILAPTYGVVSANMVLNAFDDNGIYASGSVNVAITGNYIERPHADGIACNGTKFSSITGNVIVRPRNSGIRIQKGNDLNITGNMIIGGSDTGSYMRGFVNAVTEPNAPFNINIVGNSFTGGTSGVGNPFSFGDTPTGTGYVNWKISENFISDVDTTGLTSPFFGPYRIFNFGLSNSENIIVSNNIFSDVVECPLDVFGRYQYLDATYEFDNVINHAAGFSTLSSINSIRLDGTARYSIGSTGAVIDGFSHGIVTGFAKGAATGEYVVTFDRAYALRDFTWSATQANAPFFVRMDIINPGVTDDVVSSVTLTFYDLTGTAYWPDFNCSILVAFKAFHGSMGVTS